MSCVFLNEKGDFLLIGDIHIQILCVERSSAKSDSLAYRKIVILLSHLNGIIPRRPLPPPLVQFKFAILLKDKKNKEEIRERRVNMRLSLSLSAQ